MSILEHIAIRHPQLLCCGLTRILDCPKTLYLSFDDGPNISVTENVLRMLKEYNAKASFFCKGSNANLYPELIKGIKSDGHTIGNHSYSHLNAFKVGGKKWMKDVYKKSSVRDSYFFRPPYGRIYPWQCRRLKKTYKIVLWDVMTYDYREDFSYEDVKRIILKNVREGSIIVFHDTMLAASRMLPALEFTLRHYSNLGYRFEKIQL